MSWAEVKHALNSTLGTDGFLSLDKLLNVRLSQFFSFNITVYDAAGNYTYTVPDDVYVICVSISGAGGGGGGGNSYLATNGSGGGGGAAILNRIFNVKPGEQINITIGAGGAGGISASTSSVTDGEDGENTIFGTFATVYGGKGGRGYKSSTGTAGAAGGDGGGKGGNPNGGAEAGITGPAAGANNGGGGSLGRGGISPGTTDGTYYPIRGGGGGGGYGRINNIAVDGQKGADGCVIIASYSITANQANGTEPINGYAPAADTVSTASYTTSELMTAYREGVESIG